MTDVKMKTFAQISEIKTRLPNLLLSLDWIFMAQNSVNMLILQSELSQIFQIRLGLWNYYRWFIFILHRCVDSPSEMVRFNWILHFFFF